MGKTRGIKVPPKSADATLSTVEFEQLGHCVDAIGTADFPRVLSDFCRRLCRAELVFLSAFFDGQKPVPLFANHTDEADKAALDLYVDVAYVLDPFVQLFREDRRDQVVTLKQVAPDDFKRSQYYRQFYKAIRLKDECGVMLTMSPDAALFFSMGVQSGGRANPSRLRVALPLIASLARRHWTVLSPARPDGSGRLAAHLEAAFGAFGTSVLSSREGEIVRLILKGHSSKSIARFFDNSPETIKVHRKRIYRKLGVVSQGELLSLFLDALTQMPPTESGDPLAFLKS